YWRPPYMRTLLKKLVGDSSSKELNQAQDLVDEINSLEPNYTNHSDEQLKDAFQDLRRRHLDGESLDDLLPESFAITREAAKRTLGQRHFDVQLIGGIVLHQGKIAEMKTGEGKTLTAT